MWDQLCIWLCWRPSGFEKGSSLEDDSNRNDQYDSSDEDFRGFYDQFKLHAAMPFC
jgi:hypothetical protein